jgi:hypothetical protein
MNRQETARLLVVINQAYPRFEIPSEKIVDTANLWAEMFKDKPYENVAQAVKQLITELKYPPTIADVYQKLDQIANPNRIGKIIGIIDLWNEVIESLLKAKNYIEQSYTERKSEVVYDETTGYCKVLERKELTDGIDSEEMAKEVYDKMSSENKRYFGSCENFLKTAQEIDLDEFQKFEKGNYIKLVQPILRS